MYSTIFKKSSLTNFMFLTFCHEISNSDINIPIFKHKEMRLKEVDLKWQHN